MIADVLTGVAHPAVHRRMQRFIDRLHTSQQKLLQQVNRQQFRVAPFPLPGIDDLTKKLIKARLVRFVRAEKTGLRKNRRPGEPLLPVGARSEVHPLVIPFARVGMATVVVYLARRKQQNIPRTADKLFAVVIDHPFPANRKIKDIPLHP